MDGERDILIKLNDHENALRELRCNVVDIKEKQNRMEDLIQSVNELAFNMKHMTEEQARQRKSLERLETAPLESLKMYKRQAVNSVISTLAGILVGAILSVIVYVLQ